MIYNQQNVIWHHYSITCEDREMQRGHKAAVLWFTGLSGSGKSTLANQLEKILHNLCISTYLLDGDNVRHGLCRDLGFSSNDRKENIRRIGEVVKLMVDAGLVVITAFIAPHRVEREKVRNLFKQSQFIEVFVDTPLEICEKRDPKNLYKKFRAGKIKNFTGIDTPYEIPLNPEIRLDGTQSINQLINQLLNSLRSYNIIAS